MAADRPKIVSPWTFSEALEAAGIIRDRDRISELKIICRHDSPVLIEVTMFGDERLFNLTDPKKGETDVLATGTT